MTRSTASPDVAQSRTAAATAAVNRLQQAAYTRVPCAPVRDLIGADDVNLAYAVQRQLTERRLAEGARVVGRKIGLTSPAVQKQLGVDRPDFGVLFDDMDVSHLPEVPSGRLLQAKTEAEVAFVLGEDLVDGPLDVAQVRDAVSYATAALEIVDSRIAGWDITFGDTVADNASSGLFVLGERHLTLDEFEPVAVEMTLHLNGEQVSTGNGAACLGDPLEALRLLAVQAHRFGDPLRAGHLILSGALGPFVPFAAGDRVTASISGFAPLTVTFEE